MTQAIRVKDVEVGDFILSVTTRMNDTDDGQVLEELTERTITAWLFIVDAVTTNKWVYSPDLGSVEERFCAEHNITLEETFGDSRVTVWDTWRSKRRVGFHLNSNDKPQRALQVRDANESGSNKAVAKWNATHPNTSQQTDAPATPKNAPQQPPAPSAPTAPQNAPNANVAPMEGVLVATRAPNSNRVDYAPNQLVEFTVNKIEAGSNKGSAIFKLWTALGTQYPTVTVYMKKPNGEVKPDYQIIKPVIDSLGLTLEKTEAVGNWKLICKAVQVDGREGLMKEFLNVVSFTAL